jgi:hypothetical protein
MLGPAEHPGFDSAAVAAGVTCHQR